jgi:hypothetical protein
MGGKKSGSVAVTFPRVAGVTNIGVEKVPAPGLPEFDEEPEIAEAWQPMQLMLVGPLTENCDSAQPFDAEEVVVDAAGVPLPTSVPTTSQSQPSHQRLESLIIPLQKIIGEFGSVSKYSSFITTAPSGIGPCRLKRVIHLYSWGEYHSFTKGA